MSRERVSEFVARASVGVLFVLLSINLLADFLHTHHVTGIFLLISEALVVVFTVVRRRAQLIDRSVAAAIATTVSMAAPPLFRAGGDVGLVADELTALVSIAGLSLAIAGKLALGRSFGIMPANRGVVARGPYLLVRHPIYTGYVITHLAFLAARPQPANIVIALCADGALIARALFEERVLGRDERYRAYCRRVGWHLVPGVF